MSPTSRGGEYLCTIRLLDMPSGKVLATLNGHKGPEFRLAFSPDGRLLVTGDVNGGIEIGRLPDRYGLEK